MLSGNCISYSLEIVFLQVLVFLLTITPVDKRKNDKITAVLAKEIQLKHRAPVIDIEVNTCPLLAPLFLPLLPATNPLLLCRCTMPVVCQYQGASPPTPPPTGTGRTTRWIQPYSDMVSPPCPPGC